MTCVDAICAELEKPLSSGKCPCAARANIQRAAAAKLLRAQQGKIDALTTLTEAKLIAALGALAGAYAEFAEQANSDPCTCGGAGDPTWPGERCAWCIATELLKPLTMEDPQCRQQQPALTT